MEDDLQTKSFNGTRDKPSKSSKEDGNRYKSREKKHRRKTSSSNSRSRSRDKPAKRKTKKGRSSKYSSSSSSSSSSSRSRSSSSSRSRSRSRDKIKRKNFDRVSAANDTKPATNTSGFQSSSSFSTPNQSQGGALTVADLLKGKGPSTGESYNYPSQYVQKNRPEYSFANQHARRLYVGNIPFKLVESEFVEYIYRCLDIAGGVLEPGNPIISTKPDPEKKYIFLEFRSAEEASTCIQLDGLFYEGKPLRFRRPKQYVEAPGSQGRPLPNLDLSRLGDKMGSTKAEDAPVKLFVGGIPHGMDEAKVTDMLAQVGHLKSFNLVRDKMTNASKGFGFCEYYKEADAVRCIESLNGTNMGYNRILQVKRCFNLSERDLVGPGGNAASNLAKSFLDHFNSGAAAPQVSNPQQMQPQQQSSYFQYSSAASTAFMDPYSSKRENPQPINQAAQSNMLVNSINVMNPNVLNINTIHPGVNISQPDEKAVNVLCLGNILDQDEIENDREFEEIYEDIMNELVTFGQVQSMIIPRRKDGYEGSCVGKVYVEFEDVKAATLAKATIRNYKYGGRIVDPTYYEPSKFMDRIFM